MKLSKNLSGNNVWLHSVWTGCSQAEMVKGWRMARSGIMVILVAQVMKPPVRSVGTPKL